MDNKQMKEYEDINNEVESFNDWLDQLSISSDLAYDKEFHLAATEKYQGLMDKIISSSLSESDKDIFSEIIMIQFKELQESL